MKTLSQYPLLIGEVLARAEARKARRVRWRRLAGRFEVTILLALVLGKLIGTLLREMWR